MLDLSKVCSAKQGATRVSTEACRRTEIFVDLDDFNALKKTIADQKVYNFLLASFETLWKEVCERLKAELNNSFITAECDTIEGIGF